MRSAHVTRLLEVSYSQFAIFPSGLQNPFNEWTDQHLAQGFAWRPDSVSFATFFEAGPLEINIALAESWSEISPLAKRVVEVPFDTKNGALELASISDSITFEVPPGCYLLRCELLESPQHRERAVLTFIKGEQARFFSRGPEGEIPQVDLLKTAWAAGLGDGLGH